MIVSWCFQESSVLCEGFPSDSSLTCSQYSDFIFCASCFLSLMSSPSDGPFELKLSDGSPRSPLLPCHTRPSAQPTSISATNFQKCPLILTLPLPTHVPHPSFHDSFILNPAFFCHASAEKSCSDYSENPKSSKF